MIKFEYKNEIPVAAHRGNAKYFPENTIISFKSALELNPDMIETDVHITKDGELVLIHDHNALRTAGVDKKIRDMTLEEVKALDVGSWKGKEFKGEKVPTFKEFLELCKDNKEILFNIEFKDYPGEIGELAYISADKTIALMEQYGIAERSVINSFSGELLEYIDEKYKHKYRIHAYHPLTLLGNNLSKDPYEYSYCMCLFNHGIVSSKENFDEVKSHDVETWVYYSEDDEKLYDESLKNGAVAFTSNDPKKAIEILRAKGLHK